MKLMRLACQTSMGLLVLATAYVVAMHRQSYTFVYCFDPSISTGVQQETIAWIEERKKCVSNSTLLINDLCNHYPWIAECSLLYLPNARLKITIIAHTPEIKIQDNQVVLDNGMIVSQHIFESPYLASLPAVTVHKDLIHNTELLQKIERWLTKTGSTICDRYMVDCPSSYQITLHDKEYPLTIMLPFFNEQNDNKFLHDLAIQEIGLKKTQNTA